MLKPIIFSVLALLLVGCERGPTKEDMRGCASPSHPTVRDVADCAIKRDRAARGEEKYFGIPVLAILVNGWRN